MRFFKYLFLLQVILIIALGSVYFLELRKSNRKKEVTGSFSTDQTVKSGIVREGAEINSYENGSKILKAYVGRITVLDKDYLILQKDGVEKKVILSGNEKVYLESELTNNERPANLYTTNRLKKGDYVSVNLKSEPMVIVINDLSFEDVR